MFYVDWWTSTVQQISCSMGYHNRLSEFICRAHSQPPSLLAQLAWSGQSSCYGHCWRPSGPSFCCRPVFVFWEAIHHCHLSSWIFIAGLMIAKRCDGHNFNDTDLLCFEENTVIKVLSVVAGYSTPCQQYWSYNNRGQNTCMIPHIHLQYYKNGCNRRRSCNNLQVKKTTCPGFHLQSNYVEIHYKCVYGKHVCYIMMITSKRDGRYSAKHQMAGSVKMAWTIIELLIWNEFLWLFKITVSN